MGDLSASDERTSTSDVRDAMEELVWRFHTAESSIGIRAQNMADVKGGTVFDEHASHSLHISLRGERHRWAVDRLRKVDATLRAMDSASAVSDLVRAFTPSGRVDSRVSSFFEISFGLQRASILGFALRSKAMRLAWATHHNSVVMPDQDQLLALLATAPEATLKAIARTAMTELAPHIELYSECRIVRLEHEHHERRRKADVRRAAGDAAIQATRERIWGKL